MILISVQNIQKSFGINEVLRDVTFSLQKGEKMGLVGANGCGKTTLMKIITGELQQDSGMVHKGKELRIGYLAQVDDIALDDTVWGALLRIFEPIIRMEQRMHELEDEMAASSDNAELTMRLSAEYQRVTERYANMEGYAYEGEMKGVLAGLGLREDMFDRQVKTLSGGERTRLSLAKLLLQKPDIILMDEPTNHLDLEAIEWLQGYLTEYKGSLLIISHDRYFLDRVCTTMGELLGGRMMKFTGNYSEYMRKRTADVETRMKAYNLQQKEIERELMIIERYRSFNREKSIKAAESRQKRLDKVERLEKPLDEHHVRFSFDARRRSGEEAMEVRDLSKSFDQEAIFENVSFKLRTGDRVALIGPNGVGKSTLFKILMNKMTPDRGAVKYGTNVDVGYYDQHQQELNPGNTVLDEVWNSFPTIEQTKIRGALGLFLFTGDDVFDLVGQLSGGERGRVALTKLMLKRDNLLLLDEPTNHLDMDSREVLEDALQDFQGTILAISHDRYFINRFADKVMVMNVDGVTEYLGNFDDYVEKRDRPQPPSLDETDGITKTAQMKERKRDRQQTARIRELKAVAKKAEEAIEANDAKIAELEVKLSDPQTYENQELMREVTEAYRQEQERTSDLYDALEAAEEAVAQAEEQA
ncbi:MAG: ABC-F family ATP-binding cassette domain-containing protein [Clostridiales bacterium]|nr:ABC-F family ATP-binding cassette domain-containing protein [Clostridiales bacterium]